MSVPRKAQINDEVVPPDATGDAQICPSAPHGELDRVVGPTDLSDDSVTAVPGVEIRHDRRKMVKAELMGSHTHETKVGVNVLIYLRDGRYIARGRYNKKALGEKLGADVRSATSRLRHLLTEIEDGTYVRRTEARKRPLRSRDIPLLTLYDLCNDFLSDKRRVRGQNTAENYRSRLAPVLEFAESAEIRRRWPLASNVDRDFVIELKSFLMNRQVTRNGRDVGNKKSMTARQIKNCLETLRNVLGWGRQLQVRKLPLDFANPVTNDLVPAPPAKDPLRKSKFPVDLRTQLAQQMDNWQILHLSPLLILPLRHEDIAGMLISDVDWEQHTLSLGTRFGGADFNKGRVAIEFPLPLELMTILRACRGDRLEGPLFRSRDAWNANRKLKLRADSLKEVEELFERELASAAPGTVQCFQDRKRLFRQLLQRMGGMSDTTVGSEYSKLFHVLGWTGKRAYDLRGAVTSDMKAAGIAHLELRYLTEHSVNDILNAYTGIDPAGEIVKYYRQVRPLLETVLARAAEQGELLPQQPAV